MRSMHLIFLIGALTSGCAPGITSETYVAAPYLAPDQNVALLKALAPAEVAVGEITSDGGRSQSCQLFDRIVAPQRSFERYIREALMADFRLARIYSSNSKRTLIGHIDRLEIVTPSNWRIDMTFKLMNEEKLPIHIFFEDKGNDWFDCVEPASTLGQAIANLLAELYRNPAFKEAFGER